MDQLQAPQYIPKSEQGPRIALAVESMKRHVSDEGWQIMEALEANGYTLYGSRLPNSSTDVEHIVNLESPSTLVIQDIREWDIPHGSYRDLSAKFHNTSVLKSRPDIFKVTIVKDAHWMPITYAKASEAMGVHAWIAYYHPSTVCDLAPYIRPQHLIRTYHTIDPLLIPVPNTDRDGCLLSGYVHPAYPLRTRLANNLPYLPNTTHLKHPGYNRDGCLTPQFLKTLNQFKVSICTSSMYGYSVRKIIESVACGCRVITDLPAHDVLPEIDANLVRVPSTTSVHEMAEIIELFCETYDFNEQRVYANKAKAYYNYIDMGKRLAHDINTMRQSYEVAP